MKFSRVFSIAAGLLVLMLSSSHLQGQLSFSASELLGRPTDTSMTINVVANAAIEGYVTYGTQSGTTYPNQTATLSSTANTPLVLVMSGLQSNTRYYYRLVYRQTGASSWIARDEHSFQTQRSRGTPFTFTIVGDSHINIVFGNSSLYQRTLQNIGNDHPDFHVDLGDTFAMDNVTTQTQANSAYLGARAYFGLISHSSPIFLALGNHEEEEGWHLNDTGNFATSKPVMGANARKRYFLNPVPDAFYSGNVESVPAISGDHLPGDYYAWEWGDALFVVIDPDWYTTTKPFVGNNGGGETSDVGSGDRWDWTLGWNQYQWLQQTLQNSQAAHKFIFAHHGTGGTDDYIRGGANAVPYVEWGGRNEDGTTWTFDTHRPGWPLPVHQLLVQNHVTAFFHAHDHEFAYEKRDGIVYQLLPMPSDANYSYGSFQLYHETDPYTIRVLPNSGHLRVTVSPTNVTVDYVRAFLSGAGTNGQVAYSYTMGGTASGGSGDTTPPAVTAATPTNGATGVSAATTVSATFSEAINTATLTASTFVLRNSTNDVVTATVSYNSGTNVATLTPTASLASATTYTATLTGGSTGIKDPAGNALAINVVWAFTTAAAMPPPTPPTVTATTPTNGATGVSTATAVTATFSKAINTATLTASTFVLRNSSNAIVSGTLSYNSGTNVATLTPTASLASAATYTATLTGGSAGIKDSAGSALASNVVWVFTTAAAANLTVGQTTVGGTLDSGDSNFLNGSLVTTTAGGQISSMSVYVGAIDSSSTNRQYQVAVYTNNAGRPGTLIAASATGTLVANAWNTIALGATVQPSTKYWVIYNTNGRTAAVNNMYYNSGGAGQGAYSTAAVNFGTWPASFPSSTLTAAQYSIYAVLSP